MPLIRTFPILHSVQLILISLRMYSWFDCTHKIITLMQWFTVRNSATITLQWTSPFYSLQELLEVSSIFLRTTLFSVSQIRMSNVKPYLIHTP